MAEKRMLLFIIIGTMVSLVIAMFVSFFASSFPDGLEKVAENLGFTSRAEDMIPQNYFIIPDYSFSLVDSELWQTALAGLFGVLIVLAIFGLVYLIYRGSGKKE